MTQRTRVETLAIVLRYIAEIILHIVVINMYLVYKVNCNTHVYSKKIIIYVKLRPSYCLRRHGDVGLGALWGAED